MDLLHILFLSPLEKGSVHECSCGPPVISSLELSPRQLLTFMIEINAHD
jgi:hypothetical protein